MKMKTLVRKVTFTLMLLAVNFSFTLPVNAQGVNELAKITVFRAIANGQDITKMSRDNNHCFQVYKQGADIMFANNYTKLNSKSYGRITNVSYKRNREKDGSYSDIYQFKWHWKNSFDDETGTDDVYLKVVTSTDGTAVRIVVVGGDMENILDYGGILSGSLSSLKR